MAQPTGMRRWPRKEKKRPTDRGGSFTAAAKMRHSDLARELDRAIRKGLTRFKIGS